MSTETNQTAHKSRTGHIEIPIKKTVQSQDCTVFIYRSFRLLSTDQHSVSQTRISPTLRFAQR